MLWKGLLPLPLVLLVFGRDVLLVSGTFYHRYRTKDPSSKFFDTKDGEASTSIFHVWSYSYQRSMAISW